MKSSPNFPLDHWFQRDRKLVQVVVLKINKSSLIGCLNCGFGNPSLQVFNVNDHCLIYIDYWLSLFKLNNLFPDECGNCQHDWYRDCAVPYTRRFIWNTAFFNVIHWGGMTFTCFNHWIKTEDAIPHENASLLGLQNLFIFCIMDTLANLHWSPCRNNLHSELPVSDKFLQVTSK